MKIVVVALSLIGLIGCGPSSSVSGLHGVPVRLKIPKLTNPITSAPIDVAVEQVAVDREGRMDIPRDWQEAAWYSPGVSPGDAGDAVIDAHLDWVVNHKDTPSVFYHLADLALGDEFDIVTEAGETLKFRVTDSRTLAYNADPASAGLFAMGGAMHRVSLVTCAGDWNAQKGTYSDRLIKTGALQ